MRQVILLRCVLAWGAVRADGVAAPPKLVRTIRVAELKSRFAFHGRLQFVDDDEFVILTECADARRDHPRLLRGRVSDPSPPREVAQVNDCNAFIGHEVIVDGDTLARQSFDGSRLPAVSTQGLEMVNEILAADRTVVVATAQILRPEDEAVTPVIVRLTVGKPPAILRAQGFEHYAPRAALVDARTHAVTVSSGVDGHARLETWDGRGAPGRAVDAEFACARLWPMADGSQLCQPFAGGRATVARLERSGKTRWALYVRTDPYVLIASAADGVAIVADGERALLLLSSAGRVAAHYPPAQPGHTELVLAPNGQSALAANSDGTIELWRLPPN